MKSKYLLVTMVMVVALALSACSPAALSAAINSAAVPNTAASSSAPAAAPDTAVVPKSVSATVPNTISKAPALGSVADMEQTLEQIYAQVNPSVVLIQVVEGQSSSTQANPFFGNQLPSQPAQALGSGFVWDKDGHIVTNNHVVAGATKITVTFYDGTTVPATVVGTDPDSDLAVVKVNMNADQLQPVIMGDSSQVKVGQLSVAIGNPFGNQNSLAVGFISAIARSLPVDNSNGQGLSYTIPDIIQTDAPINPGNSGGVLTDDQGKVIGVTSAIDSPVRASSGVGFAIPAAIVQKVIPELIKSGHFDHTWLGISGGTLIPDLATAMNLKSDQRGVLVNQVTSGGPADKAGLHGSDRQVTIDGQPASVGGDIIIAIDNQPVKTFDDVVSYLASSTQVNQAITLTILRNGQQQTVQVTLAARPKSDTQQPQQLQLPQPSNPNRRGNTSGTPWLGIQGLDMSSDIASAMNLSADQSGVLVEQVQSNSPAEQAGLQGSSKSVTINGQDVMVGGDVITAIDHQAITGMQALQSILRQDKVDQKVTLTILRDGKQQDVTVTLAARPSTTP